VTTETHKIKVHPNWLRFMFAVNIFVVGGLGLAVLIGRQPALTYFGFPTEELIFAGYAPSVMVAYAIMGIMGMRSPVKFAPVLLMQATGKIAWLLAIIIPQLATGPLPSFAVMLIATFIPLIIGDLIAVPWKYLSAK
jgi:spore maturation protein SpmB